MEYRDIYLRHMKSRVVREGSVIHVIYPKLYSTHLTLRLLGEGDIDVRDVVPKMIVLEDCRVARDES